MEITTNKKPSPDIFLRMVGRNINPWSVPMRTLAKVLEATQRLAEPPSDEVSIEAGDEEEDEIDTNVVAEEKPILRLLDIKRGSAGYSLAAPQQAVSQLRLAGDSI